MADEALAEAGHWIECLLDALLDERGMTVAELARRVGVTPRCARR